MIPRAFARAPVQTWRRRRLELARELRLFAIARGSSFLRVARLLRV